MKILSVIVPVYNAERYLPGCLDSILSYPASDIEVICINDGSTDHSSNILEEYARKDERVIKIDQENQGPSAARNNGVEHASGKYIVFADSDDQVKPEPWSSLLMELKDHPEIELFMTDFIMFFIEKERRYEKPIDQITMKYSGRTGADFLPIMLQKRQCFWNIWRCAYSRNFLRANRIHFRDGCDCAEDLEYTVKVLLAGPAIRFIHCPYYCYRVERVDSLMGHVTSKQISDNCDILNDCICELDRSDFAWKQKLIEQFQFEMIIGFAKLYEIPREDRPEILSRFHKSISLLKIGEDRIAHCVYHICAILGVKTVSWMLHILKSWKRILKKRRGTVGFYRVA